MNQRWTDSSRLTFLLAALAALNGHRMFAESMEYVYTKDHKKAILGKPMNPDPRGQPKFDMTNEEDDVIRHSKDDRAVSDEAYRWPKGILYYEYDSALPAKARSAFEEAIQEYHNFTCLRILPRPNPSQKDYVKVISGNGCRSSIGQMTGMQELSLGPGCEWKGIAVHELLHAFGWEHEQMRPDRDDYLHIHHDNIQRGREHNFVKWANTGVSRSSSKLLTEFCYGSVMQYRREVFSIDPKKGTMDPKSDDPRIYMGQRVGLADCDVERIRQYYQCDAKNAQSRAPDVKYRCRNSATGEQHNDGEVFVQGRMQMQCVAGGTSSSYIRRACLSKSGQKHTNGQTWTEDAYVNKCIIEDNGKRGRIAVVGCAFEGKQYRNGDTWIKGAYISKCIIQGDGRGSQSMIGCHRDGKNYTAGATWREAAYQMKCKIEGRAAQITAVGCYSKQGKLHSAGGKWEEEHFVRQCVTEGQKIRIKTTGCVGDNGKHVSPGQKLVIQGSQRECVVNEAGSSVKPTGRGTKNDHK